jgi:adenosylcobinamide kinase / adenosylcobinamide-phosphate guanylyltransferase
LNQNGVHSKCRFNLALGLSMTAFSGNQPLGRLILVTGPTRSGKSDWAEALADQSQQSVVYIATSLSDPNDEEWQARIKVHRDRRPQGWTTLEVPQALSNAICRVPSQCCLLIDALGTWVANGLEQSAEAWSQTEAELLEALYCSPNRVILVAEEVGWGIVPAYPAGRLFRDRLGELVRHVGAISDQVYLVTAGYALDLKQLGQPVPRHVKQHHDPIQEQERGR